MPIQQIDNTRVTSSPKPTGSYTHYDPKAPKPGVIQDTGTITEDNSNPVRKAIQNYTASYLNSDFANSPFMDVMRWLPGFSYIERVVTGQPVGENESLSMVMPLKIRTNYTGFTPRKDFSINLGVPEKYGLTLNSDNIINQPVVKKIKNLIPVESSSKVGLEFDPKYFQNGKFDLNQAIKDINLGKKEAINFLSSDVKIISDAHNKELAERLGLKYFRPYNGAPARAAYPMSRGSILTQADPKAVWVGSDRNGFWVTPSIIDGNALGKALVVPGEPGKDLMTISLQGNPQNSAFHETLHRGNYGTIPAVNINTAEKAMAAHHTNIFYNWKTKKLLNENYNFSDYLGDPQEAAVNALEIGKIMGLTPGQAYPGKTKALQIFSNAINSNHYKLDFLKDYRWNTKPKRVWDALTGQYYILPATGVVGTALLNTNKDDIPRQSK